MKSFPLIVERLLRSVRTRDQTIEYRWHSGSSQSRATYPQKCASGQNLGGESGSPYQ
jgi:hypothetical protein